MIDFVRRIKIQRTLLNISFECPSLLRCNGGMVVIDSKEEDDATTAGVSGGKVILAILSSQCQDTSTKDITCHRVTYVLPSRLPEIIHSW